MELFWGSVVVDLVQPGEELEFYRKGTLDLTQRGAEANTAKRIYLRLE